MKYARPVDCSDAKDGSDIRMLDLFDTDSINPKPAWFSGDESMLSRIFSHQETEWRAKGEWFIPVPGHVEPYAYKTGQNYENASVRSARLEAARLEALNEAEDAPTEQPGNP